MDAEQRCASGTDGDALRDAVRFPPPYAEQMHKQGVWNDDTVPRWLSRFAHETPDKAAIVTATEAISYRETFALGLRKGDVIAVQLPNVPELMIVYFAATMMGAVLAPIHMPYRAREMAPLLRHARARLAVCGPALADYAPAETFLALRETVASLARVIVAGPAHRGTLSLHALIEAGPFGDLGGECAAADPAILCFTSGTSAAPKAVVHSSCTMLANNRLCGPLYGLTGHDMLLSGPPFTHAFGICIINLALSVGATQLLLPASGPICSWR
jgi:cyclohexanecarboxylate-CoA ligase